MGDHAADEHWHYSIYPFIVSFGCLFMFPIAFAYKFVYENPMMAIVTFGIGLVLNLIGVAGWVSETLVESEEKLAPGAMPAFIVAEAFIFVGFFAAYWVTRLSYGSDNWPPPGTPEAMPVMIPLIMTVILVSSSFTYHHAEALLEKGNRGGFITWVLITMVLGVVFFGCTAYEWKHLIHEGFVVSTNLYSGSFFSITGFHASHVLVGLGMMACIVIPALKGNVNHSMVKSTGLYWHFVDIVWFFVISQVYFW